MGEPLSSEHARILSEIPSGFHVGYGRRGHPVFLEHPAVVGSHRYCS